MKKLTEKDHWDSNYQESENFHEERHGPYKKLLTFLKKHISQQTKEDMSSYGAHQVWSYFYPEYLPSLRDQPILEVGCAPGEVLIRFYEITGCIPYGVEYSDPGVDITRMNFAKHTLNPDNVIHSDFFSDTFLQSNANKYKVVLSGGFIEHFDNPKDVVSRHVDLAAPGGYVVISIPNLRGINRLLCLVLAPWLLPLHNLEIMRLNAFRELFADERLEPLLCRYYGSFSFDIIHDNSRPNSLRQRFVRLLLRAQLPLNLLYRRAFGLEGADSGFTSPYLIYIGRKANDIS